MSSLIMSRFTFSVLRPVLATAFLAGLALSGAARADDDALVTDRPGFGESSKVVGQGRIQVEAGLEWDRQRGDDVHSRLLTTPALLRMGLGETVELRIETDGRSIEHDSDPSSGLHSTTAGWADTELGLKWHVADQAGAVPSMGLLLHTVLPSGSDNLRGHGLRPSLRLSAEWDLPDDYSLNIMPGAGSDNDDAGAHYNYGVLTASLGRDFGARTHGYVELAAPQIASASHGGTQFFVDTGASYQLNKDCQFDLSVIHGLNRRSPELGLAFGLSLRM